MTTWVHVGCRLQWLNDWQSRLWCRFFCLSVYVTMYLNDHQRTAFYESLGLNTKQFNRYHTAVGDELFIRDLEEQELEKLVEVQHLREGERL